ncbi:hypothetical protein ZIOFF_060403 [Zingiber officinale]|uniref:PTBP1-like RNA recognition motif 2 domain-containing protein n=1 Tax=Zingiber officinale TaxID=94328 RepID=A0A8J5FAQ9_ZINOF|nr:hypothetical protein ZIOFF_060403 [Zingiber officinale]
MRRSFSMSRRCTAHADLVISSFYPLGLTAVAPVAPFLPSKCRRPSTSMAQRGSEIDLEEEVNNDGALQSHSLSYFMQNDLLQLVQPFGVVTKLVMLRAKNQALLQMHDLASAMNVIQYYTNVQPSVRGRNVYIQFSSHQELTTTDQSSQGRKGDQVVGSAHQSNSVKGHMLTGKPCISGKLALELVLYTENDWCKTRGLANVTFFKFRMDSPPNRILLVTIHQMLYPITVEVLQQVFSPCGYVEKIVTFQKSAGFQALIQFESQQSAVQARSSLQGRNIYDGCCQLDIQFSKLASL